MAIYIVLIVILLLSLLPKNTKVRDRLFLFNSLIIFAVLAFRDLSVGIDTDAYTDIALGNLQYSEAKSGIEIVWEAFVSLYRSFSTDRQLFVFLTAILEAIPLFLFIRKESVNGITSLLIFVLLVTGLCSYMTTIRQSIAVGFVLWSFYYLRERKFILSVVFILLGTGFHTTAIISVVFIPFVFLRYNKLIPALVVCASAVVGFTIRQDIFSAFDELSHYFKFLSIYSGYSETMAAEPNIFGLMSIILPSTIVSLFAIFYLKDNLYTKIFVVGVVLVNLFASTPFIERYFMYPTMLQLVLVPMIFKKGNSIAKIGILVYILILLVYFFKSVPYATGTDEYTTFF